MPQYLEQPTLGNPLCGMKPNLKINHHLYKKITEIFLFCFSNSDLSSCKIFKKTPKVISCQVFVAIKQTMLKYMHTAFKQFNNLFVLQN